MTLLFMDVILQARERESRMHTANVSGQRETTLPRSWAHSSCGDHSPVIPARRQLARENSGTNLHVTGWLRSTWGDNDQTTRELIAISINNGG